MSSHGSREGLRRKRTKFNKYQHKVLIEAFEKDPYPDFTARKELAKQIQIPEPRIQVWFQNRRARTPKNTQRGPRVEVPGGPLQEGFCTCDHRSHQGLLLRSPSSITLQNGACRFKWELEDSSGETIISGHAGFLGMNVPSPDETPARALGKPSGGFYRSLSSGFSLTALSPLSASQNPSSQLETGGTGTHLGDPSPLITHGAWAQQGWGCHPPSDEQQPLEGWQLPPAPEPGTAPQQPPSQHPGVWE